MPVSIVDQGTDNRVSIPPDAAREFHGAIVLKGSNNVIEIGEGCSWVSLNVTVGSNSRISIGDDCALGQLGIFAVRDARTFIGERCIFTGVVRLLSHEPAALTIGSDCLISGSVDIMVSDMHSIVDVATGTRLNPAEDVRLEERVWIGQGTMVLKGARIGAGSIIGAGSVVSGEIPANVAAAGVPARVIRTGITWRGDLI